MDDFATLRQRMVDNQIRPSEIHDHDVIQAFLDVPREIFVAPRERPFAYADRELLMADAAPERRMMDPVRLARLVHALSRGPEVKAMVVGGGSGYSAAILRLLVGSVVVVEEHPALAALARDNARALGATNISVVEAKLVDGYPGGSPYDAILVDGAVDFVPDALIGQLTHGGLLATIEREDRISRAMLYEKVRNRSTKWPLFEAWLTPLPGFVRPREFVF
jgi:protein-L-isoaspartate(D-aspartate) O-methyltransferase